jgi:hypothetical protein
MINTAGGENQEAADEDMEFPQEGKLYPPINFNSNIRTAEEEKKTEYEKNIILMNGVKDVNQIYLNSDEKYLIEKDPLEENIFNVILKK